MGRGEWGLKYKATKTHVTIDNTLKSLCIMEKKLILMCGGSHVAYFRSDYTFVVHTLTSSEWFRAMPTYNAMMHNVYSL